MAGKKSRNPPKRSRRRINWSQLAFMGIGLLVVIAFILSMVTYG